MKVDLMTLLTTKKHSSQDLYHMFVEHTQKTSKQQLTKTWHQQGKKLQWQAKERQ